MFRFYSKENPRVAVIGNFTNGKLEISVSRCGKKNNFSRKIGRTIAEGRLAKGILYDTIEKESITTNEFVEIANKIANEVAFSKKIQKL